MRFRLVLTLLVAGGCASSARAQTTVLEMFMQQADINPALLQAAPAVRLQGMGELGLAVIDEANEISARDFAGNAAGYLADSDRWVVETWMSGNTRQARTSGSSTEYRYGGAGAEIVQRTDSRALAGIVNWGFLETDHRPGDWSRIRGPQISALVNQRIGGVTLGLLIGQEAENEDRISDDYYSLEHKHDRWVGQIGAIYPLAGWTISGSWDFERGDVVARSVDPSRFHQDTYHWTRPSDLYTLAVMIPAGKLQGGVRARFLDREGGENVEISWSDVSPWNPSHTNFFSESTTFSETESKTEFLSRWRLELGSTIFGLEGALSSWETDVQEGINFKGSLREGATKEDGLHFAAGASQWLLSGRLLAGVQGRVTQTDWEWSVPTDSDQGTSQGASFSAGFEYFATPTVVLRGGFSYAADDRDIDASQSLIRAQGVTGGISWLPRGGLIQVHSALRFTKQEPWDKDATQIEEWDETTYLIGLRLLM